MPPQLDHLATIGPLSETADLDHALDEFSRLRPRLLAIAHRILGSWSEAEDVAQDAWLRWQACDRSAVRHPTAFLVTTTTRLALNVAQSARVRRETSIGEPLTDLVDLTADPATEVDRLDGLEQALQVLLRCLGPTERLAYVLRHAFEHPYARIADLANTTEANARQIVSRAGKHLTDGRRSAGPHEHACLLRAFDAARHGGVSGLERMLASGAA